MVVGTLGPRPPPKGEAAEFGFRKNKSGNVARTLSLLVVEMCSKWSKTGKNTSKMAQNGSNWLKMGERKGRKKSHAWSLSSSLFVRKRSLVHPFRERVDKIPFSGGSSSHCEALRPFPRFWAILGSFWVILGSFWVILAPFGASNPRIC